jgi:nucleoside-diphosphate kinase
MRSVEMEKTLAIIKPDAFMKGNVGNIIAMIEKNGFKINALKLVKLCKNEAEGFYYVHKDKPFFKDLINFMTSGPIIVLVLKKDDAVSEWRKLMGSTDPKKAEKGTIRNLYGTDIEKNAVHGSDSLENAAYEISYFFPGIALI